MANTRDALSTGFRYLAEFISDAVWLFFRFPLSLRMVKEMLAARGVTVTHETMRQWRLKFDQVFANPIRRRAPRRGVEQNRIPDQCSAKHIPLAPEVLALRKR
jgi:putative transposase